MYKLVKESLLEFHQTGDPLKTLGLGPYEEYVNAFFDNLNISKERYRIEGRKVFYRGTLNLYAYPNEIKLPDGLNVGADLNLGNSVNLIELPNNLEVRGSLELGGCDNLTKLSDGLKVGQSLNLNHCISLKELPHKLSIAGSLRMSYCTQLTKLPDDLEVVSNIYISEDQQELISYIENSKFRIKLYIR